VFLVEFSCFCCPPLLCNIIRSRRRSDNSTARSADNHPAVSPTEISNEDGPRSNRKTPAGSYCNAESIVVAIPQTNAEKRGLRGTAGLPRHNEATFTAAEIGDQIVGALERRIAMMKEELKKLGVETAPRLREV
jgi:hypothetical protein